MIPCVFAFLGCHLHSKPCFNLTNPSAECTQCQIMTERTPGMSFEAFDERGYRIIRTTKWLTACNNVHDGGRVDIVINHGPNDVHCRRIPVSLQQTAEEHPLVAIQQYTAA